mmetsp:Transcript_36298/g.102575  ORF Transcript_36298/g.102575 Transcript_36298/m.102575 type:complete len:234 (-) Transcript_36298:24-725(-)
MRSSCSPPTSAGSVVRRLLLRSRWRSRLHSHREGGSPSSRFPARHSHSRLGRHSSTWLRRHMQASPTFSQSMFMHVRSLDSFSERFRMASPPGRDAAARDVHGGSPCKLRQDPAAWSSVELLAEAIAACCCGWEWPPLADAAAGRAWRQNGTAEEHATRYSGDSSRSIDVLCIYIGLPMVADRSRWHMGCDVRGCPCNLHAVDRAALLPEPGQNGTCHPLSRRPVDGPRQVSG